MGQSPQPGPTGPGLVHEEWEIVYALLMLNPTGENAPIRRKILGYRIMRELHMTKDPCITDPKAPRP